MVGFLLACVALLALAVACLWLRLLDAKATRDCDLNLLAASRQAYLEMEKKWADEKAGRLAAERRAESLQDRHAEELEAAKEATAHAAVERANAELRRLYTGLHQLLDAQGE